MRISFIFRCKILKEKKEEQLEEISLLQNDEALNEKGEVLATKLDQCQEQMKNYLVPVPLQC